MHEIRGYSDVELKEIFRLAEISNQRPPEPRFNDEIVNGRRESIPNERNNGFYEPNFPQSNEYSIISF